MKKITEIPINKLINRSVWIIQILSDDASNQLAKQVRKLTFTTHHIFKYFIIQQNYLRNLSLILCNPKYAMKFKIYKISNNQ